MEIYELVIMKDNILRKIKELVDLEKINLLQETIHDNFEHLKTSLDKDKKIWHLICRYKK